MTINKKKGYSLIELMFVMVLLVLFGLTTFTLVISGSKTYNRLTDIKNENSELRVAISYAKMEIKQNDAKNAISVRKSFIGTGNAIVIEETLDNAKYEKWIYCSNGKLKELYVDRGSEPEDNLSMEIADISTFEPALTDGGISIRVSNAFGKGSKSYSTVIALHSRQ